MVLIVSATDRDYADYGQVRYEFTDIPPDNRFIIDSVTVCVALLIIHLFIY